MIWVVAACLAGFLLVCAAVGYIGKLKHTTEDIPQKSLYNLKDHFNYRFLKLI